MRGKIMSDYLSHHGILGMKWGVRRYQNEDGSLTPAGKARMRDVESSNFKSKRDTKRAKKIYRDNANKHDFIADIASRRSEKLEKRANKYAKGTDKNIKLKNKAINLANTSKISSALANIYTQKIRDINDGKIKAGRDFIIQRDYDGIILPGLVVVGATYRIIENPKKN